jgi:hypothetical protein
VTRRKFLLTGGSVLALGAGIDGFFFEPRHPVIERVNVTLDRLPQAFHGFRIALISDIHYGPYMDQTGVRRAVDIARTFQPDLLALTGDFVSHPLGKQSGPQGARHAEPCADALVTFSDVQQVAILGNHDHWNNAKIVEGALKERGIEVLRNRSIPLERYGSRIWISGVDDVLAGAADIAKAIRGIPPEEATVLLVHEPDFADRVAHYPVDLQLSGHSHGGQVRLPLVGAIILPELAHKYSQGLNRVGKLQVYTNKGLGVINPAVRFNCPPEITFVTLMARSRV